MNAKTGRYHLYVFNVPMESMPPSKSNIVEALLYAGFLTMLESRRWRKKIVPQDGESFRALPDRAMGNDLTDGRRGVAGHPAASLPAYLDPIAQMDPQNLIPVQCRIITSNFELIPHSNTGSVEFNFQKGSGSCDIAPLYAA